MSPADGEDFAALDHSRLSDKSTDRKMGAPPDTHSGSGVDGRNSRMLDLARQKSKRQVKRLTHAVGPITSAPKMIRMFHSRCLLDEHM